MPRALKPACLKAWDNLPDPEQISRIKITESDKGNSSAGGVVGAGEFENDEDEHLEDDEATLQGERERDKSRLTSPTGGASLRRVLSVTPLRHCCPCSW